MHECVCVCTCAHVCLLVPQIKGINTDMNQLSCSDSHILKPFKILFLICFIKTKAMLLCSNDTHHTHPKPQTKNQKPPNLSSWTQ